MENKLKHLEMIQGIINRMASNSFALKGWSVTLVAGIFALSSKDANEIYFLIAYIPIIVFWFLDAYYLLQERLFRSLYGENIITLREYCYSIRSWQTELPCGLIDSGETPDQAAVRKLKEETGYDK